jgi:hypothetical protein
MLPSLMMMMMKWSVCLTISLLANVVLGSKMVHALSLLTEQRWSPLVTGVCESDSTHNCAKEHNTQNKIEITFLPIQARNYWRLLRKESQLLSHAIEPLHFDNFVCCGFFEFSKVTTLVKISENN